LCVGENQVKMDNNFVAQGMMRLGEAQFGEMSNKVYF
jgi:hypothetical protein